MPGSTTQSQNVTPWEGATDALTQNIGFSQAMLTGYDPKTGKQTDPQGFNALRPELTYSAPNYWTQQAQAQQANNAYGGYDTAKGAYNYANQMLGSGGLMPWQNNAVGSAQAINQGVNAIDTNPVQQYYNMIMGTTPVTQSTSSGIATGQEGINNIGNYDLLRGQIQNQPSVGQATGIGNIATGAEGVGTVGWQALMNRLNGGYAGYGNQPAGTALPNAGGKPSTLAGGSAPTGTGGPAGGAPGTSGGFNYPTAYDPFGGGPAAAYLGNYASGAMLDPKNNPYFSSALDTQSAKTAEDVNRQFSGMGRYGSGAHTGTLAQEIGNTRTAAMQNQFNTNQQLQQQAVGQLGGERQANIGNQMNILGQEQAAGGQNIQNRMAAAGLLGGERQQALNQVQSLLGNVSQLQGQNIQNRLGASGQIAGERQNQFNQGQSLINNLNSLQGQNIGNVLQAGNQIGGFAGQGQNTLANLIGQQGNMYNALMSPGATMGQIGEQQHADALAYLKSQFDYQQQAQQAPWDRLAAANAIATGAGKLGSETRQEIPVASQIGSLLGNVLKFPIPGIG